MAKRILIRSVAGVLDIGWIDDKAELKVDGVFEYFRDEKLTRRASIYPSTLAIIIQEATKAEYNTYLKKVKLIDDNQRIDNDMAFKLISNKRDLNKSVSSGADLNQFIQKVNGNQSTKGEKGGLQS